MDDLRFNPTQVRAMRMLSRRSYSARELEKKLVEKGEAAEDARQTVEWLEGLGYINDAEYAEMVARHYQSKGYGHARIKDEMHRRGIARDYWGDALGILEKTKIEDAALGFLEKKLRGGNDENDLRRALDALVRRGFSYEEAKSAVNRYLEAMLCQTISE